MAKRAQSIGVSNFKLVIALIYTISASASTQAAYLWPLPYGKELTSVFADWRSRHYHTGIDIRTGGAIGLPVVAPDDGYVMRISMSYYGYGKALYLKMNDGRVAVFGHLDHYCKVLEDYVEQQQIKSESFNQNLMPKPGEFAFKRGDTICFSGQTGVGAPHLHFEIRTAGNVPLNPLAFDGIKVNDTQAPVIRRLRLIGLGSEKLEQALGRKIEYSFRKSGATSYQLNDTLECDGEDFTIAIDAVDIVGMSDWEKPVYSVEVRQANKLLYRMAYDSVSFEDSYQIDKERNYQMAVAGSKDFYNIYPDNSINLCASLDGKPDPLEIVVRDIAGNSCRAIVPLKFTTPNITPDYSKLAEVVSGSKISSGNLAATFVPSHNKLFFLLRDTALKRKRYSYRTTLEPNSRTHQFTDLGRGYYLAVADSVSGADSSTAFEIGVVVLDRNGKEFEFASNYQRLVPMEGKVGRVSSDGKFRFSIPGIAESIFPLDRCYYFDVSEQQSKNGVNYLVSPNFFPLAKAAEFGCSFQGHAPKGAALYAVDGESFRFLGNGIDTANSAITATSFHLGTVSMRIDTTPPTIRELTPLNNSQLSGAPTIRCKISDNLSGILSGVEVRIDGKWCIPEYDPESGWVSSKPHFNLEAGKHDFEVTVTDRVGNKGRSASAFVILSAGSKAPKSPQKKSPAHKGPATKH